MSLHLCRSLAVALVLLVGSLTSMKAQYQRTVLIEEFTSVTCKPCTTATAVINQILTTPNAPRIAVIRNQVKNPSPVNPYSTAESEDRADYYDINMALPFAGVDGNTVTRPNDQSQFVPRVEDRLLEESPLQMTVTQSISEGQASGNVAIQAGQDGLPPGDYKLYIVAVERMVHDPTITSIAGNNGETTLYDVMRKMVNGQSGASFTIDADGSVTVPFNYSVASEWQSNQMYTVAFVQREGDNEVMQAGFSVRPQSGVAVEASARGNLGLAVAPQPARDRATASFALDAPARANLTLLDATGTMVRTLNTDVLSTGRHALDLNLVGLPAGIYTCTIEAADRRGVQQVVIVR